MNLSTPKARKDCTLHKKVIALLKISQELIGPLQLGSLDHNFLKNILSFMSYSIKNARNEKMAKFEVPGIRVSLYVSWNFWKIPRMSIEKKCLAIQPLKIQTVIKSHSLMPGASNLAILMFSTY